MILDNIAKKDIVGEMSCIMILELRNLIGRLPLIVQLGELPSSDKD